MSFVFPENQTSTRRNVLRWAAGAVLTPLAPLALRAACPCGPEKDDDGKPATRPSGAATRPAGPGEPLRVCIDPNNLPYSNRNRDGFEMKIAELVAAELQRPLQFDWLPQRLGFFRTALKTFDSHLVMAAPAGFDKAKVTRPYYRSSYVFVYRRGIAKPPRSFDDPALRTMKIGVLIAGSETPPTQALASRKIIDNIKGFSVFDETEGAPAARIVKAVASGDIDVACLWGPQAGYFVKKQEMPLEMVNVSPEVDGEGAAAVPFTFKICMAVRRSETALLEQINGVIARRQKDIDRILDEFSVPRLALDKAPGPAGKEA